MIEVIKRIEKNLDFCYSNGEDPDQISWGDEKGILISANEARMFVKMLQEKADSAGQPFYKIEELHEYCGNSWHTIDKKFCIRYVPERHGSERKVFEVTPFGSIEVLCHAATLEDAIYFLNRSKTKTKGNIDEVISKFKNGKQLYSRSSVFNSVVKLIANGQSEFDMIENLATRYEDTVRQLTQHVTQNSKPIS